VFCLLALGVLSSFSTAFGQYRPPSTGRVEYTAAPKKAVVRRIAGNLQAAVGKATLFLVTDPTNSDVFIDGVSKGKSSDDGSFQTELPTGKDYKVEVKKDRYIPYTQQVKIDSPDVRFVQANLAATFGGIKIIGDTPEDAKTLVSAKFFLDDKPATVSVDEAKKQVTINDVPTGEHKIAIYDPSYVVWDKDIEVVGGFEMTLAPKLVAAAKLNIRTVPGVDVLIDKVKQGTTSSTGELQVQTPLQPGEHQIELQKAGFVSIKRPINLSASVNNQSFGELEPLPRFTEFVDFFNEGLNLWSAPSSWKWNSQKSEVTISDTGKKTASGGLELGLLKGKGFHEIEGVSFRDFQFVFDLKFVNGIGAAWVIRADSPDTYYLFELTVKDQKLHSSIVVHGQKTELNTPTQILPTLNNTTSFSIRADVQGNIIRHYIKNNETADEELMGITVDETLGSLSYGTVGFTATNGAIYALKDVRVNPYKESAVKAAQ
jgi:hypothetical protein